MIGAESGLQLQLLGGLRGETGLATRQKRQGDARQHDHDGDHDEHFDECKGPSALTIRNSEFGIRNDRNDTFETRNFHVEARRRIRGEAEVVGREEEEGE